MAPRRMRAAFRGGHGRIGGSDHRPVRDWHAPSKPLGGAHDQRETIIGTPKTRIN